MVSEIAQTDNAAKEAEVALAFDPTRSWGSAEPVAMLSTA